MPKDDEESDKRIMKRVEANDPSAMNQMGAVCYEQGDYDSAFEYFTKAAELGEFEAHYQLASIHEQGKGVEKDDGKAVYHYEKAAIGGDPSARHNLGCYEEKNRRVARAVKHWIIAANLGHIRSMEALREHYNLGNIGKEELEATLRAHQAAIDATKNPQRDAAAAAQRE